MVMFTCNRCSAALKKSQVENHAFGCGGLSKINLTCHDCLKDFRGKEYESHTSCISEEARYGGKNVVVKEVGKKQNQWCEVVQNVLANNKTLEPSVYRFLKSAEGLSNIPRKKPQFRNWASNVKISSDYNLIDKVFDLLKEEFSRINLNEQPKPQTSSAGKDKSAHGENGIANKGASNTEDSNSNENVVNEKISRKKKKKKNMSSADNTEDIDEDNGEKSEPTDDSSLNGVDKSNQNDEAPKKKKKKNKKSKDVTMETSQGVDESIADDIVEEPMELEGSPVATKDDTAQGETAAEMADQTKTQKLSKKELKLLKKKAKFEAEVAEIQSFKKVEEGEEAEVEEETLKKNKKRKNEVAEESKGLKDDGAKKRKVEAEELETEVPPKEEESPQKAKFNWHETILAVLRKSKNDEVPVKKVTKRVIDEYISQHGDKGIHEKLNAKMNKKLQTCPGIRVLKDKVKLLE